MNLGIIRNLLPPPLLADLGPRLDDSQKLIAESVGRLRGIMADLRPPMLDEYGLLAALRWYADRLAARMGFVIEVVGADPAPRLSVAIETALFRVAQEALTNVIKHARAHWITIRLEAQTHQVCLRIEDDGIGFEPGRRRLVSGTSGLGMVNMRERVQAHGGTLKIVSAPGQGTRVDACVPRS